jgi:hypothetical protein
MSSRYTDTVYNKDSATQQNRARGSGGPDDPYVSSRGYSSNEERLTSVALASALDPPTAPTRGPLFPPRFIGERTQPTIQDVLSPSQAPMYPGTVEGIRDWSGSGGSYSGTATPGMSNG